MRSLTWRGILAAASPHASPPHATPSSFHRRRARHGEPRHLRTRRNPVRRQRLRAHLPGHRHHGREPARAARRFDGGPGSQPLPPFLGTAAPSALRRTRVSERLCLVGLSQPAREGARRADEPDRPDGFRRHGGRASRAGGVDRAAPGRERICALGEGRSALLLHTGPTGVVRHRSARGPSRGAVCPAAPVLHQ